MGCNIGKQLQHSYLSSESSSSSPFDLVHSDVWGPTPFVSKGGHRFYVIFVDDFSRYTWVYMMRSRADFFHIYIDFVSIGAHPVLHVCSYFPLRYREGIPVSFFL